MYLIRDTRESKSKTNLPKTIILWLNISPDVLRVSSKSHSVQEEFSPKLSKKNTSTKNSVCNYFGEQKQVKKVSSK